jgi:Ser/Thr protein kinase RdoA (MazF antagonist)
LDHKDTLTFVADKLELGTPVNILTGVKGATYSKYKLTTDKGTFFIKEYKNLSDKNLRYIHDVELFMIKNGIPAISPVNKIGNLWIRIGDIAYKPYLFIENITHKQVSETNIFDIGILLAKLHKVGQNPEPESLKQYHKKLDSKEYIKNELDKISKSITLIENPESLQVKNALLDHIKYKMSLLANLDFGSYYELDTIVHGDFHSGNLMFDVHNQDKIIGICDWDRTMSGSHTTECIDAMMFFCFFRGKSYTEEIKDAQKFIEGYRTILPISNYDIGQGLKAFLASLVMSCALEKEFINKNRIDTMKYLKFERDIIENIVSDKLYKDIIQGCDL